MRPFFEKKISQTLNHSSEQPDSGTWKNHTFPRAREWMSERANERVSGASERASGRVHGSALMPQRIYNSYLLYKWLAGVPNQRITLNKSGLNSAYAVEWDFLDVQQRVSRSVSAGRLREARARRPKRPAATRRRRRRPAHRKAPHPDSRGGRRGGGVDSMWWRQRIGRKWRDR